MLKVKETNATFIFAFESLPRTGSYLRIINLLHMDKRGAIFTTTEQGSTSARFYGGDALYNHEQNALFAIVFFYYYCSYDCPA